MMNVDLLSKINTPAYVADRGAIRQNLQVAARVKRETGCKMLLATKAFSMFSLFSDFAEVLDGTTASGLYEARLGHEHFGGEVHAYSPAYSPGEIEALLPMVDHLYFNSVSQLSRFRIQDSDWNTKGGQQADHSHEQATRRATGGPAGPTGRKIKTGLRVNPELSLVKNSSLYDPSAPHSRFGVKREELTPEILAQIDTLHVHNLCENMAEDSVALIHHLMQTIPQALDAVAEINLGGGHYFTHPDYNVEALIAAINQLEAKHHLRVILEPGGALVYNAGWLVASVLDVIPSHGEGSKSLISGEGAPNITLPYPVSADASPTPPHGRGYVSIAILDTSATCHMPDVLEVPYTPQVVGATSLPGSAPPDGTQNDVTLLTGKTCLTGDIIGQYHFAQPLKIGDKVVFEDMMQYSMVKNTTFNGMPLPDIGILQEDGTYRVVKSFGYADFKQRLS